MPPSSSRQLVTYQESGLGVIEYSEVVAALNEKKAFNETSAVYSGRTFWNWKVRTVKQFKKTHAHPTFGDSTARKLRDRYNDINKQKRAVDNKKSRLKRGRPLLLGAVLGEKVNSTSIILYS